MDARNLGQAFSWSIMGGEAISAIHDLRWMIVACIILIIADFRFGRMESKKRHSEAVSDKDTALAKLTEFHASRAIRRTCNKFIDYMTLLLMFCILGLAMTEPLGLCSHIITSGIAVVIACVCELCSIFGHILYIKGLEKPKFTWESSMLFIGRVAASFARTKSEDFGNALDDTVEKTFASKDREQQDIEPINNDEL